MVQKQKRPVKAGLLKIADIKESQHQLTLVEFSAHA